MEFFTPTVRNLLPAPLAWPCRTLVILDDSRWGIRFIIQLELWGHGELHIQAEIAFEQALHDLDPSRLTQESLVTVLGVIDLQIEMGGCLHKVVFNHPHLVMWLKPKQQNVANEETQQWQSPFALP